ncbi:MAG: ABC transporter permease [Eubacteriaceae bacterium]|nr:ABC transporter permease [Eubacteriaceae bacterium]
MKALDLIIFSFQNLWRRKSRTVLTLLGVMIGAASIVVMMSLGVGMNKSFMDSVTDSGTLTMITVYTDNYWNGPSEEGSTVSITRESTADFKLIDHVVSASVIYDFDIIAKCGKYEGYMNITAVERDMLEAMKIPLIQGEIPSAQDGFKIIAGKRIAYNFYDPTATDYYYKDFSEDEPPVDLMNDSIFVIYDTQAYYNALSGVGEMPKKYLLDVGAISGIADSEMYSNFDYGCYADLDAVEELFNRVFKHSAWPNQTTDEKGKPVTPMTFRQAYVYVDDLEHVEEVQKTITDMGYRAYSEADYLESMKQQSRLIQYVLGGIGSVSLFVAAIGITNTMLMSIYERTKEIGIFKVLGCSLGNIRSMFLFEAGMIGLGGGVLGLALSFGLSFAVNMVIGETISVIPLWLAMLGLGFSVLVGMVAGLSPALRAMRLSPLEAIRTL